MLFYVNPYYKVLRTIVNDKNTVASNQSLSLGTDDGFTYVPCI